MTLTEENAALRERVINLQQMLIRAKIAKLNVDAVLDIRGSLEPHKVLAHRHGVSVITVWKVQTRRSWRWVK